MKHAYLLLIHDDIDLANVLIEKLNHKDNDIYIHIDGKSKINQKDIAKVNESKIYFTPRLKCEWGTIELVKATYILLEKARENKKYDYYHLLSGQDLPIKDIDYINEFFKKNIYNNKSKNRKTNYIYYYEINRNYIERYSHYNFYIEKWRTKLILLKAAIKIFNYISHFIQRALKINRFGTDYRYLRVGSEWWSISDEFCDEVMKYKSWVFKKYNSLSFASDESFIQTIFAKTNFLDTLYIPNTTFIKSNLREIDFSRGNGASPHEYKIDDLGLLLNSENLFARKFSTKLDEKIIERLK